MRKLLVRGILPFLLILIFVNITLAQNGNVKFYEIEQEILEHNQLPLNPYPPFGLLTGYICYPYQFYGSNSLHNQNS